MICHNCGQEAPRGVSGAPYCSACEKLPCGLCGESLSRCYYKSECDWGLSATACEEQDADFWHSNEVHWGIVEDPDEWVIANVPSEKLAHGWPTAMRARQAVGKGYTITARGDDALRIIDHAGTGGW